MRIFDYTEDHHRHRLHQEMSGIENERVTSAVNILNRTGQLMASTQTSATENGAIVSTNKIYAAIHQFGGTITIPPHSETHVPIRYTRKSSKHRKGQFKGVGEFGQGMTFGSHTVNIPPRPFLILPDTGIEKIKGIIGESFTS